MRWILGVTAVAVVIGIAATMTIPAQTITPDSATLKLFPPETEGIGSVDVASLRNSPLFNELILQKLPPFPAKLSEFADATGFVVQRDIDQVTAGRVGERSMLVVVRARYDKFKLEQFVQDKADDLKTETYLGRVIYTGDGDSDKEGGVTFIDNLIVAGNLTAVKQAIDRMAAPAPSVVDNGELMNQIRTIESGNQIWAAGKFDEHLFPSIGQSPEKIGELANSLKSGTFQMRIDQDIHIKASGSFTTADMAKATSDTLRGLLAMGKLQFAQQEQLQRLLDGINIENRGDQLLLTINANGDLLKQLQEMRGLPKFGRH